MSPGGAIGLDKLGKNRLFVEKSYLATPDHFLSAIFGISVKFHVDIGVQKMFEIFFRDEKCFSKKCFFGNV